MGSMEQQVPMRAGEKHKNPLVTGNTSCHEGGKGGWSPRHHAESGEHRLNDMIFFCVYP